MRTLKTTWEALLSIGSYSGESDVRGGKRRIVVGYLIFGALVRPPVAAMELMEGLTGVAVVDFSAAAASVLLLIVLFRRPDWFVGVVNVALFLILVEVLSGTLILGGLVPSEMVILWGLLVVVGSLIALSLRAALAWTLAYGVSVVLAVVLPELIDPMHTVEGTPGGIAAATLGVTVFVFAAMAYFVRQRDQLQSESDDLLHNILPDEIAARLKSDTGMIVDDYEIVSVLFADVVGFTPMSAGMTPPQLVGLLNEVFSAFDGFVAELGLEKIKTVGDEYMVAGGVPKIRSDHAHAIADLAIRIRDHVEANQFQGHHIQMRIGINSGPVVAGIVGTHKFAYDLWGDVVNTASRMESEGVPGSIQVTETTFELLKDEFVCEPRGKITVKGKGEMTTFFLLSRRPN